MKNLVVGLGNSLVQDDGIGLYIIDKLLNIGEPINADFVLCGTDIFRLLNYYENQKRIILIDAFDAGLVPGTVICLNEQGLFSFDNLNRSTHQISMIDGLKTIMFIRPDMQDIELYYIGIQIENLKINEDISQNVKKAGDIVIKELFNILKL